MKKLIYTLIIFLFLLCSCRADNTNDTLDIIPDDIIDEVYENLADDSEAAGLVPEMMTAEINENTEEYYLGVSGIRYKKGAASEATVQPVTYSFCVIVFEDGADYVAECSKIERNLNKSKWVCASADDAIVVRYKNTAAVIMGAKTVCSELEAAFLSVMSAKG